MSDQEPAAEQLERARALHECLDHLGDPDDCAYCDRIATAFAAEHAAGVARRFPIMDGPSVLWSVIAPHEQQALVNHQQNLEKLASRGGLASFEALAVVNGWNLREGLAVNAIEKNAVRDRWRAFVLASEDAARLTAIATAARAEPRPAPRSYEEGRADGLMEACDIIASASNVVDAFERVSAAAPAPPAAPVIRMPGCGCIAPLHRAGCHAAGLPFSPAPAAEPAPAVDDGEARPHAGHALRRLATLVQTLLDRSDANGGYQDSLDRKAVDGELAYLKQQRLLDGAPIPAYARSLRKLEWIAGQDGDFDARFSLGSIGTSPPGDGSVGVSWCVQFDHLLEGEAANDDEARMWARTAILDVLCAALVDLGAGNALTTEPPSVDDGEARRLLAELVAFCVDSPEVTGAFQYAWVHGWRVDPAVSARNAETIEEVRRFLAAAPAQPEQAVCANCGDPITEVNFRVADGICGACVATAAQPEGEKR